MIFTVSLFLETLDGYPPTLMVADTATEIYYGSRWRLAVPSQSGRLGGASEEVAGR